MTHMSKHYALIPAGGSGSRFGGTTPKQYLSLAGRPLLAHTVAALSGCTLVDKVLVVLSPNDTQGQALPWSTEELARLCFVHAGGETRAASVRNGLDALMQAGALESDWVLVHDAARPCLRSEDVARMIEMLGDDAVGGLLAAPVADTVKRAGDDGRVAATVSRDGLWVAQTPQMFRIGLLKRAYDACPGATDEAAAIEALGLAPRLVAGDAGNFKVTWPTDILMAEALLKQRGVT